MGIKQIDDTEKKPDDCYIIVVFGGKKRSTEKKGRACPHGRGEIGGCRESSQTAGKAVIGEGALSMEGYTNACTATGRTVAPIPDKGMHYEELPKLVSFQVSHGSRRAGRNLSPHDAGS